jgi:cell division inhibitor SepF
MDLKNTALKFFGNNADAEGYEGPYLLQSGKLEILVRMPHAFEDATEYADALMHGCALMVSFAEADDETRNRIFDYLNGVSYIIHASVARVSPTILLYAPEQVEVDKQLARKTSWLSR